MKKGDVLEHLLAETMAAEGKSLARHDGLVVFLKGAAPGDVVSAALTKIKPQFLEATVTRIEQLSPYRTPPVCSHFGICGGCSWQHIIYTEQLKYKEQQVSDNLTRIGGLSLPKVNPILASAHQLHYRNKLDFTFTSNRWLSPEELSDAMKENRFEAGLGYHIPRMYDRVFDVETCYLQPEPSNSIRLLVKEIACRENIPFFDLKKQTGFLRTLTIRTTTTGEVMVILQVTYDERKWIEKILSALTNTFPQITSCNYIINGKRNDTFADLDINCWKGNPYITEKMAKPRGDGHLQFRIGPKSFYQTNPLQAYELYKAAWKMAALTGQENVFDLYTGTGTIANFIAAEAGQVLGIEYVEDAVRDARINSQLNNINNTRFIAGDMKDILNEAFTASHAPDAVITDPPRTGMHEEVSRALLRLSPKTIVYVSCNPATQARDLKILSSRYRLTEVQPVDMFPHTVHVENVVKLERID